MNLHIWIKPEDENSRALFTISEGEHAICYDMDLDAALNCVREHIERAMEEGWDL